MRRLVLAVVSIILPSALFAQAPEGYYRFPTIHGATIVFAAEGDLWKVGTSGGTAQRLTSHAEGEAYPAISPDGTTLAFSASYEGPLEVYTMPLAGGLPVRRTYEGRRATVVGWTPDGTILYSTDKYSTLPNRELAQIDLDAGVRTIVPLAQAADGSYDRSGGTLFFTRLAAQGSRTKRYMGGTAQNIWKYAPGGAEAIPLTADYAGTSRNPMWWNGRVYFESDRDGTMNIWSMNADGGDLRQHTYHSGWDVKDPSLNGGRIVYQLGADIRLYDIETNEDRAIPVTLTSDFDQARVKWVDDPMEYLTSAHIAPDGDRIALTARGQVFVAPVKQGRFVKATRGQDVRYREARFMPDGESLLVMSDESGEIEWWRLPTSGVGPGEQLTDDGKVIRYDGVPSPDGNWVVTFDRDQELWLYNIEKHQAKKIDFSPQWGFSTPSWSPDSRWLAYGKPADNSVYQIYLYNLEDGTTSAITTDRYDSWDAGWSADGEWIYFLSDRNFQSLVRSPWGSRQPEPFFDKQTKIYGVALQEGARWPFQPDDELYDAKSGKPEKNGESESPVPVVIELDGIQRRIYQVPVAPGNYGSLSVNGSRLFWTDRETSLERKQNLIALDIKNDDPKPKTLVEGVRGYELSANGEKLLVRKGSAFYVIAASSGADAKLDDAKVDLSGWTFAVDPKEEWRQMFVESWRLERDYFYDRRMHGVDWPGMLQKYLPLVDRVTNRAELSDLQSQMVAELSALHIFVYGGDHREGEDQIDMGSLGAVLARDEVAGGYRVDHIYLSDPDEPNQLSPLARPNVEVAQGDVIQAVNGVPTLSVMHIGALLRNQAGRQVRLSVRSGSRGAARDVIVTPISMSRDFDLRYDEWEYTRRLMTDSLAGGAIGYVHLRAMGGNNIAEWQRHFYPVFNRQGLIIDMRHNRGGNIDSWVLEKLLRRAWFYWQPRVGAPSWNMQYAFRGHMVVLVDERTASDGEAFAEGFRRLGLGKVIGTRTWGGEIWLSSSNFLVDRGIATAAETGVYGPEREWLIEGHGVDPDIVVDNLPHATFNGDDAQLLAAIEHLQQLIHDDPRSVPPPPPYPDKSVDYRTTRASGEEGGGR
ncbi:MAG: S41 family peptidase [Gemmatimonadota bacterium]